MLGLLVQDSHIWARWFEIEGDFLKRTSYGPGDFNHQALIVYFP
jgi:hypothetical protein